MTRKCRSKHPDRCRVHGVSKIVTPYEKFFSQNKSAKQKNTISTVPVKSFTEVYHVGLLNPELKKEESYEGQGLSFSLHPEEWQQIARLSGETWTLKKDYNKFLDYHKLSKKKRKEILEYGVSQGYVEEVESYQVSWWDDEWEDTMIMSFSTLEEAEQEVDDPDVQTLSTVKNYAATTSFPDTTVKEGALDVDQILTTVWVNEMQPQLDGVWWQDDLDPSRLSAPRGVIVPNKINEWLNK